MKEVAITRVQNANITDFKRVFSEQTQHNRHRVVSRARRRMEEQGGAESEGEFVVWGLSFPAKQIS